MFLRTLHLQFQVNSCKIRASSVIRTIEAFIQNVTFFKPTLKKVSGWVEILASI